MSRKNADVRGTAEAIHAAAIRLLRIVRREDARAGVAPAQLSALSVLVFHGPTALGELAAAEQVKPPTMSRIVQSLVKQGLVQRTSRAADRRSLTITATPAGRRLLLAGRDRRVRALAKRLGRLSAADIATIGRSAKLLSEI